MKKIFLLIGIVMFSIMAVADNSRYVFRTYQTQGNSSYNRSGYMPANTQSQNPMFGNSMLGGTMIGSGSNTSIYSRGHGDLAYEGGGENPVVSGGDNRIEGGYGSMSDPTGNSPVGDAILPLSLMLLALGVWKWRRMH